MRETFIRSKFQSLDEKRFRFDTSYITRVVTSKTIKVDVYKDAARADLSNRERERGFRMTSECRHCSLRGERSSSRKKTGSIEDREGARGQR